MMVIINIIVIIINVVFVACVIELNNAGYYSFWHRFFLYSSRKAYISAIYHRT